MRKKVLISIIAICVLEFAAIVAFELRCDILAAILFMAGFCASAPIAQLEEKIRHGHRVR